MSEDAAEVKLDLNILHIEDDIDDQLLVRESLVERIREGGLKTVGSLGSAIAMLKLPNSRPDAILLDLNLPDGVGIDSIEIIRGAAPDVPILVLSDHDAPGMVEAAKSLNVEDFLPKRLFSVGATDGEFLHRILQALQRSRIHLAHTRILKELPGGVVVIDGDDRVCYVNIAARNLLYGKAPLNEGDRFNIPLRAEEPFPLTLSDGRVLEVIAADGVWMGKPCKIALMLDQSEMVTGRKELQRLAQEAKEAQEREMLANEKLQTAYAEVETANDELRSYARKVELSNQELQRKQLEAENANRSKSEFLTNMSHELRTPLNAMLVLSGMLARNHDGSLTAENVENAQMVHDSGNLLLQLINDILDLSKVESGKMDMLIEPVEVAGMATRLQRRYRSLADEKGLEFSIDVAADVPEELMLDRTRVEQVLGNLIGNAVKFTEKGSIAVCFSAQASVGDDSDTEPLESGRLLVSVRDTGIGVQLEKQEKIFQAFEQAEGSTTRNYGGTGLGLSISRKLAWLMEGDLVMESDVDRGSTFTLNLPLRMVDRSGDSAIAPAIVDDHPAKLEKGSAKGRRSEAQDAQEALNSDFLYGKSVLVVDDDMRNVFAQAALLQNLGMRVFKAADGQKALNMLDSKLAGVDLLLTDVMMPGLDGLELVSRLRADERFHKLPIVICTARVMEGDAEACMKAGANFYVSKPVKAKDLVRALECAMASQQQKAQLPPAV